ncbi:MAG: hypothetical protein ACNA7J_09810 [Wenzhouxiangella sp.]
MKIRLRQVIKGQATIALLALCSIAFSGQAMASDRNCLLLGMLGATPPQCEDEMNSYDSNTTQNAAVSFSDVFSFVDREPVENAASVLTRSVKGVSYTIDTTRLEPEAAYTIWAVIFNNPEQCMGTICSSDDFGDPTVEASVFWTLGRVTDASGQATFTANIIAGETPEGEGRTLFGDGLINPNKAEIHFIVRSHGPVENLDGEVLDAALTTVDGGCEVNVCDDQQFSVHLP